jgi:hypothetical protein
VVDQAVAEDRAAPADAAQAVDPPLQLAGLRFGLDPAQDLGQERVAGGGGRGTAEAVIAEGQLPARQQLGDGGAGQGVAEGGLGSRARPSSSRETRSSRSGSLGIGMPPARG